MIAALIPWVSKMKAVFNDRGSPAWTKLMMHPDLSNPGEMKEMGKKAFPAFFNRMEFQAYSFYVGIASCIYRGHLKPGDLLHDKVMESYLIRENQSDFAAIQRAVFHNERVYDLKLKQEQADAVKGLDESERSGFVGHSKESLEEFRKSITEELIAEFQKEREVLIGVIRGLYRSAPTPQMETSNNVSDQAVSDEIGSLIERMTQPRVLSSSSGPSVGGPSQSLPTVPGASVASVPLPAVIVPGTAAPAPTEAQEPAVNLDLVVVNKKIGNGYFRVEYKQPFGSIPDNLKGKKRFEFNVPLVTLPEMGDFTSCKEVYDMVFDPDFPLSRLNTRHKLSWQKTAGNSVLANRYRNIQKVVALILHRKKEAGSDVTIETVCSEIDHDTKYKKQEGTSVALMAREKGIELPDLGMESTYSKKLAKPKKKKEVVPQGTGSGASSSRANDVGNVDVAEDVDGEVEADDEEADGEGQE
ncbi:hypothetical protein HDU99_004025 [Rhizoclosmatium hyalinum]|nr:hypothetical protein HDU99_004025 [Rhizoclosmatium hyalinum]